MYHKNTLMLSCFCRSALCFIFYSHLWALNESQLKKTDPGSVVGGLGVILRLNFLKVLSFF